MRPEVPDQEQSLNQCQQRVSSLPMVCFLWYSRRWSGTTDSRRDDE